MLGDAVVEEVDDTVIHVILQIPQEFEEAVERLVLGQTWDVLHGDEIRGALPD